MCDDSKTPVWVTFTVPLLVGALCASVAVTVGQAGKIEKLEGWNTELNTDVLTMRTAYERCHIEQTGYPPPWKTFCLNQRGYSDDIPNDC